MRAATVIVLLALALMTVSGCSATTAARPVVICGTTLYSGAVGLFVYSPSAHAVGPHPFKARQPPPGVTSSTPILFQLSTDCVSGVRYSVVPNRLVRVENQIDGTRGGVVAVSLVGLRSGQATLTVLTGPNSGWSASFTVAAP
jgi:hypothetical protein